MVSHVKNRATHSGIREIQGSLTLKGLMKLFDFPVRAGAGHHLCALKSTMEKRDLYKVWCATRGWCDDDNRASPSVKMFNWAFSDLYIYIYKYIAAIFFDMWATSTLFLQELGHTSCFAARFDGIRRCRSGDHHLQHPPVRPSKIYFFRPHVDLRPKWQWPKHAHKLRYKMLQACLGNRCLTDLELCLWRVHVRFATCLHGAGRKPIHQELTKPDSTGDWASRWAVHVLKSAVFSHCRCSRTFLS